MKKYEHYNLSQLQQFCNDSTSYREVAQKIGYAPDGGSGIAAVKEMIQRYNINTEHFTGQSHQKNLGKTRTATEDYLNNKVKITSHKLRLRLLEDGIFEHQCMCCNNTKWLDKLIPLELHHEDGNKDNNNLDNLSLLCPNCHVFTDTYKTKNWNRE